MSKYGVFSVFFSVRIRTKYGPEKTPYLDNFHAVNINFGAAMRRQKNLRFITLNAKVKVQKIVL